MMALILADRIRIDLSDILSRDKDSYLTYVILTRLPREGCTLVVIIGTHAHGRQVTSVLC